MASLIKQIKRKVSPYWKCMRNEIEGEAELLSRILDIKISTDEDKKDSPKEETIAEVEKLRRDSKKDYDDVLHVCGWCKKTPAVKKCSRCSGIHYCNKECQTKDWNKGHKNQCKRKNPALNTWLVKQTKDTTTSTPTKVLVLPQDWYRSPHFLPLSATTWTEFCDEKHNYLYTTPSVNRQQLGTVAKISEEECIELWLSTSDQTRLSESTPNLLWQFLSAKNSPVSGDMVFSLVHVKKEEQVILDWDPKLTSFIFSKVL